MSDELDERIRKLPRSIEPAEDLWPGISARIQPRRGLSVTRVVALLAAAVLLVWFATWTDDRVEPQRRDQVATIAPPPPELTEPIERPAPAPTELIPGEGQLRSAAGELALAYEQRRPLRDRELLAVYESNLGIVDDAIDRSRAALVDRPEDPQLQRALDRAYRHKLALLRRAAGEGGEP